MTTHVGKEGIVKIGANLVAEVNDWEIVTDVNTVDDSELKDDWETHLVGRKRWTGRLTCHWDETDTNGQGALVEGASVALNVYPEGDQTGDVYFSGTATVINITRGTAIDATITRSFNFQGNGVLNEPTV